MSERFPSAMFGFVALSGALHTLAAFVLLPLVGDALPTTLDVATLLRPVHAAPLAPIPVPPPERIPEPPPPAVELAEAPPSEPEAQPPPVAPPKPKPLPRFGKPREAKAAAPEPSPQPEPQASAPSVPADADPSPTSPGDDGPVAPPITVPGEGEGPPLDGQGSAEGQGAGGPADGGASAQAADSGDGNGAGAALPGPPGPDRDALWASYKADVDSLLQRAKFYPRVAKRARQEGRVVLSIEIDASGAILTVEVESSSGYPLLDDAARESVESLGKLPPPPAELGWTRKKLQVPYVFELS